MTDKQNDTAANTISVIVHSMTKSCERSMMVELRSTDNDLPLPEIAPGAHIDLHVPGPRSGAPAIVRQYSLLNTCASRGEQKNKYQIAVLREADSAGGSVGIHDRVRVGDELTISSPRNHFPLHLGNDETANVGGRTLLLAGGIGITPLASMAEELHARGAEFNCHHYAASETATPLKEVLQARPFAEQIQYHSSADGDGFSTTTELPQQYQPGDHLYVCGPAGFIEHAQKLADQGGWPQEAVHWEKFKIDEPVELSGDAFQVVAASTGQVMDVHEDSTIAEVLENNGYQVELSCEQGICGSCITSVLDGIPDHRDDVQSDEEHAANNQINVCCSRSKSASLTLDI